MSEKKQSLREYLDEKLKPNSLKAPDRNPLVAPQADLAKKVKEFLNKYETKKLGKIDSPWNKYGAGHSIGDLLFGQSPELLDDISYGLNPFTSGGKYGRLPIPDKRLLDVPVPTPSTGGLGVIKNKGGNWLTGSVENALKELKQYAPGPDPRYTGYDAEHAINSWIDSTLTKYVKNRMASPDDEVRKLADQGILHYEPPRYSEAATRTREIEGTPQMGVSDLAKSWEDITDLQMWPRPINNMSSAQINKDPWISKLDPETAKINTFPTNSNQFGFDHLIDELLNATNPDSGLPMNLRMKPEGFKGLTMEEAVRKVHGINRHRTLQAEAARKKMSRAEGIPTTKTYDDGFRWVAPEDVTKNPKHREYVVDAGKRGAWCTQGDACDHYAGGDSRVQILLDDFGNPHAQIAIETEPRGYWPDIADTFDEKTSAMLDDLANANPNVRGWPLYDLAIEKGLELPDIPPPKQRITEIKPLGNSWNDKKVQELLAKDPNYQNKIQEKLQDFVKSGDWSDVNDLEDIGMIPTGKGYFVAKEVETDPDYLKWISQNYGVDLDSLKNDGYHMGAVYDRYLRSKSN